MKRIVEKVEVKGATHHFLYSKIQHLTDSLKMGKHMTQLDAIHSALTIEALCTEIDILREELARANQALNARS